MPINQLTRRGPIGSLSEVVKFNRRPDLSSAIRRGATVPRCHGYRCRRAQLATGVRPTIAPRRRRRALADEWLYARSIRARLRLDHPPRRVSARPIPRASRRQTVSRDRNLRRGFVSLSSRSDVGYSFRFRLPVLPITTAAFPRIGSAPMNLAPLHYSGVAYRAASLRGRCETVAK